MGTAKEFGIEPGIGKYKTNRNEKNGATEASYEAGSGTRVEPEIGKAKKSVTDMNGKKRRNRSQPTKPEAASVEPEICNAKNSARSQPGVPLSQNPHRCFAD